jgi:hypothetical protein
MLAWLADCCTLRVAASHRQHKVFASFGSVFLVVEADLASRSDVNMFKTELTHRHRFKKWDWVESRRRERKVPFDS